MEYLTSLEQIFEENSNPIIAAQQKAYMKDNFEYHGIKTPLRREITKPFLQRQYLPPKSDLPKLVKALWSKPERDFHYVAMELCLKYTKQFEKNDLRLWEFMALNNSWWDSIDVIAPKLLGTQFLMYPDQRDPFIEKWLHKDNFWMKRCCILFQLKHKDKIDLQCLSFVINSLLGSKEFFINKAIGWILREHSKTDPDWVKDFVYTTELSNLSKREAMKYL